ALGAAPQRCRVGGKPPLGSVAVTAHRAAARVRGLRPPVPDRWRGDRRPRGGRQGATADGLVDRVRRGGPGPTPPDGRVAARLERGRLGAARAGADAPALTPRARRAVRSAAGPG